MALHARATSEAAISAKALRDAEAQLDTLRRALEERKGDECETLSAALQLAQDAVLARSDEIASALALSYEFVGSLPSLGPPTGASPPCACPAGDDDCQGPPTTEGELAARRSPRLSPSALPAAPWGKGSRTRRPSSCPLKLEQATLPA